MAGGVNTLLLSAKALRPETADDYRCDHPDCHAPATGYVFMGPQFCDEHRDVYVKRSVRRWLAA